MPVVTSSSRSGSEASRFARERGALAHRDDDLEAGEQVAHDAVEGEVVVEEGDLRLGRERLPRSEVARDLLVVVEHRDLDRHGESLRAPRPWRRAPLQPPVRARARPRAGRARARRRRRRPARRARGGRAGRGAARPTPLTSRARNASSEPGEQPADEQRGRRGDARDVRRRDGVVELQVAEPGEHERATARRRARPRRSSALEPARPALHQRGARHPQVGAGHGAVEPVGELGLVRRSPRGAPSAGHGLRQAAAPRRRRARGCAESTCARCTRRRAAAARSARPRRGASPRPQPPQRVGAQAPQPARSTASRWRARRGAGARARRRATTAGTPGRRRPSAASELRAVAAARPAARPGRSHAGGERRGARSSTSAREPRERRLAAPRRAPRAPRAARRAPRPCAPRRRAPARSPRPSPREQPRRSARRAASASAPSRSTWLSTTSIAARVAGERPQVALVQRGVGVLLRVDDPDEQVDQLDEPVDLERGGAASTESKSGQVEQHEAVGRAAVERVPRAARRASRAAASAPSPQTAAVAVDGRRPPHARAATSSPPGERVEQRRLARAGRARRARRRWPRARGRAARRRARRRRAPPSTALGVQAAVGELDGLGERAASRSVERAAHRARSTRRAARRAGARARSAVRARRGPSSASKRAASRGEQRRDARAAGPRGPAPRACAPPGRRSSASSTRLADRRRAARDRDLRAGQAAGLGEHGEHHDEPGAVDAERGEARGRALAGRPRWLHELEDVALPRADLARGCASSSSGEAASSRGRAREQRAPGRPAAPVASAARSAARSAAAWTTASTLDSHRRLQLGLAARALPVTSARTRSRSQPTPRLQRAHQVARADDLVPAREHLAAQQRAAADRLVDLVERRGVGAARRPRAARRRPPPARRAPRATDARRGAAGCRARRSACGARARRAPARRPRARRASRARARARGAGSRPSSSAVSGTTSSSASPSPRSASIVAQVVGDLVRAPRAARGRGRARARCRGRARPAAGPTARRRRSARRSSRTATRRPRRAAGAASARLASTTESMSGESSSASPGGSAVRRHELERARARRRAPRRAAQARAGCGRPRTSAGRRDGRRAPARASSAAARPAGLTSAPTRLLTSVDLPAPVEPPTTISSGASICSQPRQQVVVDLADELAARGRGGVVAPGHVERELRRPAARRRALGGRRAGARRSHPTATMPGAGIRATSPAPRQRADVAGAARPRDDHRHDGASGGRRRARRWSSRARCAATGQARSTARRSTSARAGWRWPATARSPRRARRVRPPPAVRGRARVLREQAYHVYALRFEALQGEARAALARSLATWVTSDRR